MVCKPFKFWCPTPAGGYGDQMQFKKNFCGFDKEAETKHLTLSVY